MAASDRALMMHMYKLLGVKGLPKGSISTVTRFVERGVVVMLLDLYRLLAAALFDGFEVRSCRSGVEIPFLAGGRGSLVMVAWGPKRIPPTSTPLK